MTVSDGRREHGVGVLGEGRHRRTPSRSGQMHPAPGRSIPQIPRLRSYTCRYQFRMHSPLAPSPPSLTYSSHSHLPFNAPSHKQITSKHTIAEAGWYLHSRGVLLTSNVRRVSGSCRFTVGPEERAYRLWGICQRYTKLVLYNPKRQTILFPGSFSPALVLRQNSLVELV